MMKAVSYRKKNWVLLLGAVLFGVLSYWLSIGNTLDLYHGNKLMEAQIDSSRAAPAIISHLASELHGYESSLRRFSVSGGSWEERILQQVAPVCQQYSVTLIRLPPPSFEEQNGYRIYTRAVKMEGTYQNLVRVIHELEQNEAIGRITSVRFALEEDRKTRRTRLGLYIYMQHIENERDHEK